MSSLSKEAYDGLIAKGYTPEQIERAAKEKGLSLPQTMSGIDMETEAKRAVLGKVTNVGRDLVGGLVNAGNEILASGAKPGILEGLYYKATGQYDEKAAQYQKAADEQRALGGAFSRSVSADPESGAFAVGQMGGRALPYMIPTPLNKGDIAKGILSGWTSKGVPSSVTKYLLSHGIEGGISDAIVATVVGDNPALEGASGFVGGGLGRLAIDVPGVRRAVQEGNINSAIDVAAAGIASEAAAPSFAREAAGLRLDHRELAKTYRDLVEVDLGAAIKTGKTGLARIESALKRGGETADVFIKRESRNQGAFTKALDQYSSGLSAAQPRDLETLLFEELESGKKAALDAYDASLTKIGETLRLPDGFSIDDMPVSRAGVEAWAKKVTEIQKKFGFKNFYEYAKTDAITEELIESLSAGNVTMGQLRTLSRSFLDPDAAMHVPNEAFRAEFREGLNNAMAESIREMGGDQGDKLAAEWLASRKTLAKHLEQFEQSGFKKIINNYENVGAAGVARLASQNERFAAEFIDFLTKTKGSADVAKGYMARGIVENAIDAARASEGAGGSILFDASRFDAAITKSSKVADLVMTPQQRKELKQFAELAQALDMEGTPLMNRIREAGGQQRTEILSSLAEQGAQQQQTAAAISPRAGFMERAGQLMMSGVNKYFKQNAIDQIMMSSAAQAHILTDPQMVRLLSEDMAAALGRIRNGLEPSVNMKMAARMKSRLAMTDPDLFKQLYGSPKRSPRTGGISGGLAAALTQQEEEASQGRMPSAPY